MKNYSCFIFIWLLTNLLYFTNCAYAQIQKSNIKSLEERFQIKIDSTFIFATPNTLNYENENIIEYPKKQHWYNNITIYEIKALHSEQKQQKSGSKPAVFMLPGGGLQE